MASPTISIGLPAFNCEETLALAIRSIVNQTYDNWELLVMEDGSSDRTLEVARRFSDHRISVFSDNSHRGLVPRLNQAVEVSRGKYFARMDADDVAFPERLESQIDYLQRHSEVDLLGCRMLMFRDNGLAFGCRPTPQAHKEICRRPSSGFCIAHPTLMGRTSWFRAHPYDPNFPRAEDQVLLLRSYTASHFVCLPEILYGYREDRLLLRKILLGRYGFAKGVFSELFNRRNYFAAIAAVLKQIGKAHVDFFAVSTGLKYRILAHRARPLEEESLQRWTDIWSQLQDASHSELPQSEWAGI